MISNNICILMLFFISVGKIGLTIAGNWREPKSESESDLEASNLALQFEVSVIRSINALIISLIATFCVCMSVCVCVCMCVCLHMRVGD